MIAEWNPERQLWEGGQTDLFSGLPAPFSETWPISGTTRNGQLLPLPPSGPRTAGSGSSSSPTPPAGPATGGPLLPSVRAAQGETRNNTVYVRASGPRGNLESVLAEVPSVAALLPTPLSGAREHGSPNQKDSGGNPSLAPAVLALLNPQNPGPMLSTPDTVPDAPNSGSNMVSRPAGLTNQIVEAQAEVLLPTPMTNYAGSRESLGRWRPGSRRAGDLQVLLSNPDLMESGGVLPVEGEMALLPTPVCTDAFGSARHTTTTGVMHAGTSLTDAIRLLPTPAAVDGHPSNPGRHNTKGHTTLPGVAKELGQEAMGNENLLLPTPCAGQSGCSPEDHLRKKPGRNQVTDLAIVVENDLLQSGGVPDWALPPESGPALF